MATDLYAILGVSPSASSEDITRAFHLLVRQHHPDTRPSDQSSSPIADGVTAGDSAGHHDTALQDAVDAYRVLNNPIRRTAYDDEHYPPAPRPQRQVPLQTWIRETTRPPIIAGPVYWQPPDGRSQRRQ